MTRLYRLVDKGEYTFKFFGFHLWTEGRFVSFVDGVCTRYQIGKCPDEKHQPGQ